MGGLSICPYGLKLPVMLQKRCRIPKLQPIAALSGSSVVGSEANPPARVSQDADFIISPERTEQTAGLRHTRQRRRDLSAPTSRLKGPKTGDKLQHDPAAGSEDGVDAGSVIAWRGARGAAGRWGRSGRRL